MNFYKFFLLLSIVIIHYPASAQDPYGCMVYSNGANRLFTDYNNTDGNFTRHYQNTPSQTYYVRYGSGDPNCGVLVDYTYPFEGGCKVAGVGYGGMARRISPNTCELPFDDYIPVLIFPIGIFGFVRIRKKKAQFVYSL